MKKLLLVLLFIPFVSGITIQGQTITEPFVVNDSINLTLKNNNFYSEDFLIINCQEGIQLGLVDCKNINITITAINNNFYGTEWIIYSDEINTEKIFFDKNYYTNYNGHDSLFVFEKNHDIIDNNPRNKPFLKSKPLKRSFYMIFV